MGSVQNFFTSRDNNTDPATYVGQLDRLWYNPDTNQIFVSDGSTPGGRPVDLGANANALINTLTVSNITATSGNITVTGNLIISGDISPATETKIGGIKAGPGANISNDGTLTIDTAGLPFSFGDFTANTNILTLVNVDQDMVLATKGNAEIQLVGNVGFYRTNGLPPNINNRYFSASDDGQILILTPVADAANGAVEIRGSESGNALPPQSEGSMIHITGNNDTYSAILLDAIGNVPFYVSRRFNGNTASPTQVLDDQQTLVVGSTPYTDSGFTPLPSAFLTWVAAGDQTSTNYGSNILVYTTAENSTTTSLTATFSGDTLFANVIEATGNITGNFFIGDGSQLTGITANTANITSNVITFNTAAGINVAAGQMAWNSADGTLNIGLSYADVVLQVGQETHYVVRNDTGNIIQNGTAVYCSGVTAGSGRIEASPMMGNISPVKFLGLATQDISNGVNGVVTYFGYVRGLDTRGTANTAISVGDETWAVGDQLYVHPTAAGKLTNVAPEAPNVKICVASIMTRNQTSGVVFVRPTSNLDLSDLSDVQITTPSSNQILMYDSNRWQNVPFGLPVYADATARDAAITTPTAGMLVYVTGTGMQVRGATSWNTIAGSGT